MNYPQGPRVPTRAQETLVAAAVGVVLIMGFALFKCSGSKSQAGATTSQREAAANRRAVEERAAADRRAAEEQAELQALRTACSSASVEVPPMSTFFRECRERARDLALSPSTVKMPGIFEEDGRPMRLGCEYRYKSWFDASNALGGVVRHRYICTLDPRTNYVTVKLDR